MQKAIRLFTKYAHKLKYLVKYLIFIRKHFILAKI